MLSEVHRKQRTPAHMESLSWRCNVEEADAEQLVELAAACNWEHYKLPQWQFLLLVAPGL